MELEVEKATRNTLEEKQCCRASGEAAVSYGAIWTWMLPGMLILPRLPSSGIHTSEISCVLFLFIRNNVLCGGRGVAEVSRPPCLANSSQVTPHSEEQNCSASVSDRRGGANRKCTPGSLAASSHFLVLFYFLFFSSFANLKTMA